MQVYRDLRVITARPTPEDEARVPHRLYGHIDAAAQLGTLWREKDFHRIRRIEQRRQSFTVPFGERPARRLQHFQRARDPCAVARLEPR